MPANKKLTELLPLMPQYLGEMLYPGGCPLLKENVKVHGKEIWEYTKRWAAFEGKQSKEYPPETIEILGQYLAYYLHAPMFQQDIPGFDEMLEKSLKIKTHDDLWDVVSDAMNYGLDPL